MNEKPSQQQIEFLTCTLQEKIALNNVDREIRMGKLRLKYVQLMRDAHSFLGDEDANILIKESKDIWDKLSNSQGLEV